MTKDELWKAITKRHPHWEAIGEGPSLTLYGVKQLFDKAWDEGHRAGVANGRALAEIEHKARRASEPDDSVFGRIFGKAGGGL